jgi:hypothetical protein
MSLINDALKRASQSDRERPRRPETHASMEPAADGPSRALPMLLACGGILALGLAGWFIWQGWSVNHSPEPVKVETPVIATAQPAPTPPPTAPKSAAVTIIEATATGAPEPAPAPPEPQKPVQAPWPADLKLSGIFFNATNPRSLINGTVVHMNDVIEGIRVTKIEKDSVTVEWNGQVKEIRME